MASPSRARLRDDLARLARRGLGTREFSLAAARALRPSVPFDGVCLVTVDPATLLPTGEVVDNGLPAAATERLTEIEVLETDFLKFSDLSRSRRHAGGLSEATHGDLDRSLRHRELKGPHGFGDELRVALVGDAGTWGGLTLLREAGRSPFTPADARLLGSLAAEFADGVRRAVWPTSPDGGPRRREEGDAGAGVLVLARDNSIDGADAAARTWLADLGDGTRPGGGLPHVVAAVAHRARSSAGDPGRGSAARARALTPSGRRLLVEGSVLDDGPAGRVAVRLEPVRAPELAPLIADAYGLSDRERAVTELVARGHPTGEIADRLHMSPYTVQDHLKAIFDKVGVASRGRLVARLFFDHYAPRLTDRTSPSDGGGH